MFISARHCKRKGFGNIVIFGFISAAAVAVEILTVKSKPRIWAMENNLVGLFLFQCDSNVHVFCHVGNGVCAVWGRKLLTVSGYALYCVSIFFGNSKAQICAGINFSHTDNLRVNDTVFIDCCTVFINRNICAIYVNFICYVVHVNIRYIIQNDFFTVINLNTGQLIFCCCNINRIAGFFNRVDLCIIYFCICKFISIRRFDTLNRLTDRSDINCNFLWKRFVIGFLLCNDKSFRFFFDRYRILAWHTLGGNGHSFNYSRSRSNGSYQTSWCINRCNLRILRFPTHTWIRSILRQNGCSQLQCPACINFSFSWVCVNSNRLNRYCSYRYFYRCSLSAFVICSYCNRCHTRFKSS